MGGAAGVVDCKAGTGGVELKRYPKSHAFAQLSGSDNIISFTTQRYSQQPLIVRCAAPPASQQSGNELCRRTGLAVSGMSGQGGYLCGWPLSSVQRTTSAYNVPCGPWNQHKLLAKVGFVTGACQLGRSGSVYASAHSITGGCQGMLVVLIQPRPRVPCGPTSSCGCRGPGAGAEVTAGGVFSDLLRLAAYLGAPS